MSLPRIKQIVRVFAKMELYDNARQPSKEELSTLPTRETLDKNNYT